MTPDIKELVKRLRFSKEGKPHEWRLRGERLALVGDALDAADALEALAGEVEQMKKASQGYAMGGHITAQRIKDLEVERDRLKAENERLKAALVAIVKAEYSGGAKTAIARKALGNAS